MLIAKNIYKNRYDGHFEENDIYLVYRKKYLSCLIKYFLFYIIKLL